MKKSDLELHPKTKKEKPNQPVEDYFDIKKIKARLNNLYPLGIVPRSDIGRATGGILSSKTMSNMDARGEGIKTKLNVGRKRCYPVDDVVDYVATRVVPAPDKVA